MRTSRCRKMCCTIQAWRLGVAVLLTMLICTGQARAQSHSPDILFQNQISGQLVDWQMSGVSLAQYRFLTDPGSIAWKVVGSGDFTGDGNPDILLQNQSTGQLLYWAMDGRAFVRFGFIQPDNPGSPDWHVVAVTDLDGDGKPDILFQNQATGQLVYWIMNGASFVRYGFLPDPGSVSWKVVATADFNKDGSADIVLQNQQTGAIVYWLMNHTALVQFGLFPDTGSVNWRVVGAADFTGDSSPDILLQNTLTNDLIYWKMNGLTLVQVGFVNPTSPGPVAWRAAILWLPNVGSVNGTIH